MDKCLEKTFKRLVAWLSFATLLASCGQLETDPQDQEKKLTLSQLLQEVNVVIDILVQLGRFLCLDLFPTRHRLRNSPASWNTQITLKSRSWDTEFYVTEFVSEWRFTGKSS